METSGSGFIPPSQAAVGSVWSPWSSPSVAGEEVERGPCFWAMPKRQLCPPHVLPYALHFKELFFFVLPATLSSKPFLSMS